MFYIISQEETFQIPRGSWNRPLCFYDNKKLPHAFSHATKYFLVIQ